MIIQAVKDFKDKKRKGKLVKRASLLSYEDEARAKELIKSGVAKKVEIEEIKKAEPRKSIKSTEKK